MAIADIAAEQYAAFGWHVVRLYGCTGARCGCFKGNDCGSPGKHPQGNDWPSLATTDPETIAEWITNGSNVGVILGERSRLIDVEIDDEEALAAWQGLGLQGYDTPTYQGGRGPHHLFLWEEGLPDLAVVKPMGIECRLGGGGRAAQSVLPPSTHHSGMQYRWIVDPSESTVKPLPDVLKELILNHEHYRVAVPTSDGGISANVAANGAPDLINGPKVKDGKNRGLFRAAIAYFHDVDAANVTEKEFDEIASWVHRLNMTKCDPPLPASLVNEIIGNAQSCAAKTQAKQDKEFGIPDDPMVKAFVGDVLDASAEATVKAATAEEDVAEAERELRAGAADELKELEEAASKALVEIKEIEEAAEPEKSAERRARDSALSKLRRTVRAAEKFKKELDRRVGVAVRRAERKARDARAAADKKQAKAREAIAKAATSVTVATAERSGAEKYRALGLDVEGQQVKPGGWSVTIVRGHPIFYELHIDGVDKVLRLTPEQYHRADEVAKVILAETGGMVVEFSGAAEWVDAWGGRPEKPATRNSPRRPMLVGLRLLLLEESDERKPTASEDLHIVIARATLARIENARVAKAPPKSGDPTWVDGRLLFKTERMWQIPALFGFTDPIRRREQVLGFIARLRSESSSEAVSPVFAENLTGQSSEYECLSEDGLAALRRIASEGG